MPAIRTTKSWSGVLIQTPGISEDRVGEGLRRRSRRSILHQRQSKDIEAC